MATDTPAPPTEEQLADMRRIVAEDDARRQREATLAQYARNDDRKEGLAELRAIFDTKAYQGVRDRIMAVLPKLHGDAVVTMHAQFDAFEEYVRKAQ